MTRHTRFNDGVRPASCSLAIAGLPKEGEVTEGNLGSPSFVCREVTEIQL